MTVISPLKRTYVATSAAYVAAKLVTQDLDENFIYISRIYTVCDAGYTSAA